jgi:hypothetical protein
VLSIRFSYRQICLPILTIACALALVVPAFAGAATGQSSDPTAAQYGPPVVCPTCVSNVSNDPQGSLPFTGADIGFLLAAGVVLLAGGLAMRGFARRAGTD